MPRKTSHTPVSEPDLEQSTELDESTSTIGAPEEDQEPSIKAVRAELRAQGYRKCPAHPHFLDRLPPEAQQPVNGYDDPSIRPLSEFGSLASCKACVKLRSHDHRAERPSAPLSTERLQIRLEKLTQQRDAVLRRISELTTQLEAAQASAAAAD